MINKYKNILKSVILTSLATLGTSPVPTMAAPMVVASKKESEASGENQTLSEQLNNGELMSAAEMSEAPAHGSHSSHSSHSSHKSHSSSSGGSSYSSGGGSGDGEKAATIVGATVGGALLIWAIVWLIKQCTKNSYYSSHNKNINHRPAYYYADRGERVNPYPSADVFEPEQAFEILNTPYSSYGRRELKPRSYGSDVDEMIDSLVANGVIRREDLVLYKNKPHYKYNRAVKKGVRKMNLRMGYKKSNRASIPFLKDLKAWRNKKNEWMTSLSDTEFSIFKDDNTSRAVAALLVEKGYLKDYDFEAFDAVKNRNNLLDAYHKFQKDSHINESENIDLKIISILYKLPSVN